jgi:pimeloyl-ACP methyl ester carboxylesterase
MPAVLVHGVPDAQRMWDKHTSRPLRRTPGGARPGGLILFAGCGHWWPLARPAEAAAALERFWAAPATP